MSEYNCPNCGAPIEGVKCAYCGTYFFNIADIEENKPHYIRLNLGGHKMMFNVVASNIKFWQENDMATYYADNQPYLLSPSEIRTHISIDLDVVPDEKGITYIEKVEK